MVMINVILAFQKKKKYFISRIYIIENLYHLHRRAKRLVVDTTSFGLQPQFMGFTTILLLF